MALFIFLLILLVLSSLVEPLRQRPCSSQKGRWEKKREKKEGVLILFKESKAHLLLQAAPFLPM